MVRRAITAEAFETIPQARPRSAADIAELGAREQFRQYAPATMRATVIRDRERLHAWRYCGPHAVSNIPL